MRHPERRLVHVRTEPIPGNGAARYPSAQMPHSAKWQELGQDAPASGFSLPTQRFQKWEGASRIALKKSGHQAHALELIYPLRRYVPYGVSDGEPASNSIDS